MATADFVLLTDKVELLFLFQQEGNNIQRGISTLTIPRVI